MLHVIFPVMGNGFKLNEGRYGLEARGKFFANSSVVLEQSALDVLSLEVFEASLDGALGNLI